MFEFEALSRLSPSLITLIHLRWRGGGEQLGQDGTVRTPAFVKQRVVSASELPGSCSPSAG